MLERLGLVNVDATLFIMLINIGILYFVLKKFLFKPVTAFMDKRSKGIEDSIKDAENKVKDAEKYKNNYLDKLNNAQIERKEIIDKAVYNANLKADNILKEAKSEASALKVKADKDIELERKKAYNDVKSEISSIAIMAASKVLESEVDEKKNSELINKFIEEVGEVKWQN
ncbi:F0F1 ATP synthase subunit B [Sedimentibacter sp. zth1]|uniref:F0F1 ATP synthase subunit B n=1 Tax=Sedimentibacter sp. zth1 TaxID=2816908 RepID=UPI001A920F76|nr:F0F1 ATP synthase subunit B [Sedimentibacter sp. zth1]QSX05046.1 F0F1 ATP synthase subunit B [Sedimentibacter sp. zth1]